MTTDAQDAAPRFSLVVPVYNEEETVATMLAEVGEVLATHGPFEALFVDDGSRDRSLEIMREFKRERGADWLRIVTLKANSGQSAAVMAGVEQAHAMSLLGQGAGEVHCDGALADTALAAAHCDHMTYTRNRLTLCRLPVPRLADAPLTGWLTDFDLNLIDAVELGEQMARFAGDSLLLTLGESRQRQSEHHTRRDDAHLIDPAELHHRSAAAGIVDLFQAAHRLLRCDHVQS